MTEEERVAHATAVKLMGNKDYYVELYKVAFNALLEKAGITIRHDQDFKKKTFNIGISPERIAADADTLAQAAMKYIDNFGKEN